MGIGTVELAIIVLSCCGCLALLSIGGAVVYFVMNN
jgi:hypothetical protein